jgi:hypothetical protein
MIAYWLIDKLYTPFGPHNASREFSTFKLWYNDLYYYRNLPEGYMIGDHDLSTGQAILVIDPEYQQKRQYIEEVANIAGAGFALDHYIKSNPEKKNLGVSILMGAFLYLFISSLGKPNYSWFDMSVFFQMFIEFFFIQPLIVIIEIVTLIVNILTVIIDSAPPINADFENRRRVKIDLLKHMSLADIRRNPVRISLDLKNFANSRSQ